MNEHPFLCDSLLSSFHSSQLAAIKTRYEGYDATRELVIKKCREIQKAAKNSIFAMHRGDLKKAKR